MIDTFLRIISTCIGLAVAVVIVGGLNLLYDKHDRAKQRREFREYVKGRDWK